MLLMIEFTKVDVRNKQYNYNKGTKILIQLCCIPLMDVIEFRGGKDKGGPALQTS